MTKTQVNGISETTRVSLKIVAVLVGGAVALASVWYDIVGEVKELKTSIDRASLGSWRKIDDQTFMQDYSNRNKLVMPDVHRRADTD